jgi:glycosyltransferase involved in cell wall biosynthesis
LNPPVGFSLVAHHAIEALREKGYLNQLLIPSELGLGSRTSDKFDFYFDRVAAEKLEKCDCFLGWANASLHQIMKAKAFGATTFIDRGSAHILIQQKLLGGEGIFLDLEVVDRQLQEYLEVDHIIVDSTFIKDSFKAYGLEDKVHVLNLGVDVEKFKPGVKEDGIFRAIFVGGNWGRKGLKYLLRAWESLNLKNAELRIIGGATMIYPNSSVKFIGYVKNIVGEYQNADVNILPSIEDGWGMTITESCACAIPHIISVNTGCKDILKDGETGFIVPIRDIKALREKIQYFYDNPSEVKRMGRNAREAVESHTWARYKAELIELLEREFEGRM